MSERNWMARVFSASAACAFRLGAADRSVRIGVLNGQSTVYADYQGIGSVIGAQLALEDWAVRSSVKVEMISADEQNVTDVGISIARQWFDRENVDLIIDVPNSAISFGAANLAREKNKVVIASGAGISDLTGRLCSAEALLATQRHLAFEQDGQPVAVRESFAL